MDVEQTCYNELSRIFPPIDLDDIHTNPEVRRKISKRINQIRRTIRPVKVTYDTFVEFTGGIGHPGVCMGCRDVEEFMYCEPDAECYRCETCETGLVFGLEQAMMLEFIDIVE